MKDEGEGDSLSFTTNCEKGLGNASVEKRGSLLVHMYLPVDASKVKNTADAIEYY